MMMPDDIHRLSGAYAVDAVSDEERSRFEAHLEHCDACREEVASLREAAAELATLSAAEPPAALRDEVLGLIGTVRPEAPRAAERRRPRRWMWAAAAAAAVIVGAGVGIAQPWQTAPEPLTVAEQVVRAPDAERVAVSFGDGGRATVVRSTSVGRAVLETHEMAPAPEGHRYVLWLQDTDGNMRPAGVMPEDGDTSGLVLRGDASEAVGAGITVEEDPRTPVPTTDPIAVFSFA